MAADVSGRLEVEFTAGIWTDVTQWLCYRQGPVTIRQGRPTPFDEVQGAVLSCALWNDDGRFMPDNPASVYWPNVAVDKRIRWSIVRSGVTYTRFTGWIQAWRPSFPSSTTNEGVVAITAVDSLGRLGQRRMRSNWTETVLWRARFDAVACDAYEAYGDPAGSLATMTNYSTDPGRGAGSAFYANTDETLSFATDNDVSIGGAVVANGQQTCKTVAVIQGGALSIYVHLKGASTLLTASQAGPLYAIAFGATICSLRTGPNGSANGLWLRNAAGTDLGIIANLPMGQWVRVTATSRVDNAARSDWLCTFQDGSSSGYSNAAIDIRSVTAVRLPSGSTPSMSGSFGGVAALGTRSSIDWQESFVGGSRSQALRLDHFSYAVSNLGVSVVPVGALAGNVATGRWSDRSAAEVLQELMRSYSGLAWCWPANGAVYAVESSVAGLYPDVPVATIDVDGDCLGTPRLAAGTEVKPTRVDVQWPGGTEIAIDAAAEASGQQRSRRLTTVLPSAALAKAVAQTVLSRGVDARSTRIEQLTISLTGASTDHTAALFGEADWNAGLFPTQRIRTPVPTSHFGVPTLDHHVQGWTESYAPDGFTVTLDTSPAIPSELTADDFTAANGTAWSSSWWDAKWGNGITGSTVDVQSNRGRILAGAGGVTGWRTYDVLSDVEITGLVQVQGSAEGQVWWRANLPGGAGMPTDGYALVLSTAGGVRVQQRVAGVMTTRYPLAYSPVAYGEGLYGIGIYPGPLVVAAGVDYRYRIRHQGAYLSIRVWPAAEAEPPTWHLDVVDTLHAGPGRVGLAQWYAGQTALFDDFLLTTGA